MINGHSLDEPYIYRDADGTQDPAADKEFDITVPAGRLWVMGDHRSASGDSLEHYEETGDIHEVDDHRETRWSAGPSPIFWPVGRATWLSVPDEFDDIPDAAAAK